MSSGWERRPVAEFSMGNGRLLATFDGAGEIDQLFAPHIDAFQSRIGVYRSAVLLRGEAGGPPTAVPLTASEFDIRIQLVHGTQLMQAEYHHRNGPLRVRRRLGLHPSEALLLDSWEMHDAEAGLLHVSAPWMGNSTSGHCSMFHPAFGGLVHHRGRRWLGVIPTAREQIRWATGGHLNDDDRRRLWDGEKIWLNGWGPLQPERLAEYPQDRVPVGWDHVVQGTAVFAALALGPARAGTQLEMLVICGESEGHLGELLRQTRQAGSSRFFSMIETTSARRHLPAVTTLDRVTNQRVRGLCERSIDVLHALQDTGTGALMAAAEVDPHSRLSGGYGFSWPRDGAYLAGALDSFGFRDRVEHYFQFLRETQDPSGAWWQRYAATGHAGPSWGRVQIDEPASVVVLALRHYRITRDLFWLERTWPALENGLGFLEEFHGSSHPMGQPSFDLWEERVGVHAYSLGAVAAAFNAGAYLAGELSYPTRQARYHEWGRRLMGILAEEFLAEGRPLRRAFISHAWDYVKGGGHWDETPDASLLGLITPMALLSANDPAARRIVEMVRSKLWCSSVGGVYRYPGDHYRGGHPWILTTLWQGIVELHLENLEGARECFSWVLSKATPQGMLAEQVSKETGRAFWVIPLAWSHAMFLWFVREALDRKLDREIWG